MTLIEELETAADNLDAVAHFGDEPARVREFAAGLRLRAGHIRRLLCYVSEENPKMRATEAVCLLTGDL